MNKYLFLILILISSGQIAAQEKPKKSYPKSLASYEDFKNLLSEVEDYRAKRLIDYNTFKKLSQKKGVVILDSRSSFRYERKHLKGAIHLDFSDFTQDDLKELIPDPNTVILIYCNNNFKGDQIDFKSKIAKPNLKNNNAITSSLLSQHKKPVMLALNIPTFINLYGYGYKNIYELNELIDVNNKKIEFEGTAVRK